MGKYNPILGRNEYKTVDEIRRAIDFDILGTLKFTSNEMMILVYALDKSNELCTELAGVRDAAETHCELMTPETALFLSDAIDALSPEAKNWPADKKDGKR